MEGGRERRYIISEEMQVHISEEVHKRRDGKIPDVRARDGYVAKVWVIGNQGSGKGWGGNGQTPSHG